MTDPSHGDYVRCPKCGSERVERQRNQEVRCSACGFIFYFVTPDAGSVEDLDRYRL
jgi:DNA-directed RNA polymerase subunit RPC12/RpoP